MRTLIVLRHAKSSWDDPALDDFDRPLSKRGRKAAPAMGRYIREKGFVPDLVLSSPAVRTRQTAALALAEITAHDLSVEFLPELYEASAEQLRDTLRRTPDEFRHVLLIGHNPGLHDLVLQLLASPQSAEVAGLAAKLPTAALAVLAADTPSWRRLSWRCATLAHFQIPRRLT